MYIRTRDTFGLHECPSTGSYRPPFSTGGEYVGEKDAQKLLTVLSGPSPYQTYIARTLASQAASRLPSKFLRIISSPKEVPKQSIRDRFVKIGNKIVGGTIDRDAGTIYLLELPGVPGYSRLELALHEAVHLFAHPFMTLVDDATFRSNFGRSCGPDQTDVGTFQRKYCSGLGEGATQVITEEILECQGISKYYRERPYDEFTPPVREIIRIFSRDKFARAYFWGEVKEFTELIESRWGPGWQNVANLTAARRPQLALDEIKKLENSRFLRGGPKGDFPAPSRFTRYA